MVKKKKTKAKTKTKARPRPKKVVSKIKKTKKTKKTSTAKKVEALEKIGEVTHYFPHVNAAAMMVLKDSLKAGDQIYIKGHTTDFKQNADSIQLDHVSVQEGKIGQEIGLLVKSRVRIGDSVYRI